MRTSHKQVQLGNTKCQLRCLCSSIESFEIKALKIDVRKAKRPEVSLLSKELSKLTAGALRELEEVLIKSDTYLIQGRETILKELHEAQQKALEILS